MVQYEGMKKSYVNPLEHIADISWALQRGYVLLTTKRGDKVNCMTIGWGMMGIEWNEPIFVALIREGRYTREMLDDTGEFTVNVSLGSFDKRITKVCGTTSGRITDKVKELNLTLVDGDDVSVPAVAEMPLTLECRVLYKQKQNSEAIPQNIRESMYSEGSGGYHIAYYARIVNAYFID